LYAGYGHMVFFLSNLELNSLRTLVGRTTIAIAAKSVFVVLFSLLVFGSSRPSQISVDYYFQSELAVGAK
jgi:hypothetical protein